MTSGVIAHLARVGAKKYDLYFFIEKVSRFRTSDFMNVRSDIRDVKVTFIIFQLIIVPKVSISFE